MAAHGIPAHFGWARYGIGPTDVVRMTLGCEPERIRPLVVFAPSWMPSLVFAQVERSEAVSDGWMPVDDITCGGVSFSYVRSGVGAPVAGDATLALGCTACTHLLFVGSLGGLDELEQVGDLALPTHSIGGDGFSGYLAASTDGPASEPERAVHPDADFQAVVARCAREACAASGVAIHTGPVFSTDTILAQFHHLDWMVQRFGCIGIEMETAAVFRAARLVGIKAAALLQFSDVIPSRKSLFAGRTAAERERRQQIRKTVLAQTAVNALRIVATTRGAEPADKGP